MSKSWYNPGARVIRTVAEIDEAAMEMAGRRKRLTRRPTLWQCLLYPICDGPGVALLVFMPPFLLFLSLPVFDWIAIVDPFQRANWALGLLALPIFLPLMLSFAMTFGYCLLILGQMLVSSALGEKDQPRWPEWHPDTISEGLGRWIWAGIVGIAIGGFPIVAYWIYCGKIDWFDRIVFAELAILGAGYAQMALAASLLHDNLLAANPITVFSAIGRIGWDYVQPAVVAGLSVVFAAVALWTVLFGIPSLKIAAVGLWGFWVLILYEAMVVFRMLGLTYYAHSVDLVWFRKRPKWTRTTRSGRIYSNS